MRLHCLTGYICLNEFAFERKNLLAPGGRISPQKSQALVGVIGVPRGPLMQLDRAHVNSRLQEWPKA